MPYKQCPECDTDNGVRTKKCKGCGYDFNPTPPSSAMNIEELATGTWVYDSKKGMAQIEVPPELTSALDNEEIRRIIEYEGLGYCIFYYIKPKIIKDKKLKKIWDAAQQSMKKVQDYLYDTQ